MVTFDKGGRVPRLEPGTTLDGRQVGILFAQLQPGTLEAELLDWDPRQNPGLTPRIEALVRTKGARDKQTLLLALSTDLLRRFRVTDRRLGTRTDLEGNRARGYTVTTQQPLETA